jgi:hypothetical protein
MADNPTGFSESFILGLIASIGGLIGVVFSAMRKSRCNHIKCCCITCDREVLTPDELVDEPPTPNLSHKESIV